MNPGIVMSRFVRSVAAFAALFVLALPAAAQSPPPITATVGMPFSLQLGGEATIQGTGVRVRFDRVTDDSRCPIEVACVWAGVFRMVLIVESTTEAMPIAPEIILDTMGAEGTAVGLHFALLRVKPQRTTSMGPKDAVPYTVLIRADRVQ